jgi:hypothetical protein
MKTKVSVYLDTGVVCEYMVNSPAVGREHASSIIKGGYRSTSKGSDELTWYPPHRIEKVKLSNGGESTRYRDKKRAT